MKYYSQYRSLDLFELQDSLSGLSKSNRWVKLADNLPWDKIGCLCGFVIKICPAVRNKVLSSAALVEMLFLAQLWKS